MAGEKSIRMGPTLNFDEHKEKDIYERVQQLSSSHKIGDFVAHLLRLAFESPEVYGDGKEVLNLIAKMDKYGMTPTRYNYFAQVSKDVEAMKKKIDDIYDMCYKMYMLALMGKYLGLEEKTDNSLRATFILEKQITELCTTLGIDHFNHSFESNKLQDTHKKAEDSMQFILESYDGIVKELKASMQPVAVPVVVNNNQPAQVEKEISTKLVEDKIENKQDTSSKNKEEEDEIPELIEKPKEQEQKIEPPSKKLEAAFMAML